MDTLLQPDNAKPRKVYLDIVRILAIFLVLFTHTGQYGPKLYTLTSKPFLQFIYIMLDCLRTINNPLLFMVSGALLLGKQESIKDIWRKRISRFILVLIIFTYIQAGYSCIINGTHFDIASVFLEMLRAPVKTSYWYLYSYISFLITLPFLRKIAQNIQAKDGLYLFIIGIIVLDGFRLLHVKLGIDQINLKIFTSEMNLFFPLLGYLLDQYGEKYLNKHWTLPLLGICSLIGVYLAAYNTRNNYELTGTWSEAWITLFYSVTAVFVFALIMRVADFFAIAGRKKMVAGLKYCSGTMFGIYLLENFLKELTKPVLLWLNAGMPTILACMVWLLFTMMVGSIIVGLAKRIPGIKRLI